MRSLYISYFIILLFQLNTSVLIAQNRAAQVQKWSTNQPSRFTENKGQVTDQDGNLRNDVKYIYSAPGFKAIFKANNFSYEVYMAEKKPAETSEATVKPQEYHMPDKFNKPGDVIVTSNRIDIELPGANKNPQIIAEGKSTDYNNYYLAYTPQEGVQNVYSYNKITYKNIWPKIDLVFYARKEGELKYDIVVHPGGELKTITFLYHGAENVHIENGNLSLQTSLGRVQENIPLSYTSPDKQKVNISYSKEKDKIGFAGEYDKNKTLVIDPIIIWGTYYGGINNEFAESIFLDKSENVAIAGSTVSTSYIASSGAFQTTFGGKHDAFIVKFTGSGKRLWATYYGGTENDYGKEISGDKNGNLYLAGSTYSTTGISTSGVFQQKHKGGFDAFLLKLDNNGTRKYSTYYGTWGHDEGTSVVTDTSGYVFFIGWMRDTTTLPIERIDKTFIIKFDSIGNLEWKTQFGEFNHTYSVDIILNKYGYIYISGSYGFLAKFDDKGSKIWSALISDSLTWGEEIFAEDIIEDDSGYIYMAGRTNCTSGLATAGAFKSQTNYDYEEAFLAKFDTSGTIVWSTYYGGDDHDGAKALAKDKDGFIYLAGWANSKSDVATSNSYQNNSGGTIDAFLAKFTTQGQRVWGTYFGGLEPDFIQAMASDTLGNIYLFGHTESYNNFATKRGYQTSNNSQQGSPETFLLKFTEVNPDAGITSIDSLSNNYCGQVSKPVYARIKNYSAAITIDSVFIGWTFNGSNRTPKKFKGAIDPGDTSQLIYLGTVKFIDTLNTLKIWTYDPVNHKDLNAKNDTLIQTVKIYPFPESKFQFSNKCENEHIDFINQSTVKTGSIVSFLWIFGDGDSSTAASPSKAYSKAGTYQVKLITTSNNGCMDSISKEIIIYPRSVPDFSYTVNCADTTVYFINQSTLSSGIYKSVWDFGDSTFSNVLHAGKKYSAPGIYTVKLVTTTSFGCKDSITKTINILPLPNPAFTAKKTCLGDSTYFQDSSTSAVSWLWYFGDNQTSTEQHPSHKYSAEGSYNVSLVVKNANNCTSTKSKKIEVYSLPQSIFSVSDICVTDSFQFTSKGKGATQWYWKFGDDAYSFDEHPKYKYSSAGRYDVWLIVSNNNGCKDSVMHTITVDSSCVWPGDANADKVVDNKDILAIGLAYADTGTARIDTSTLWKAHLVKNWSNNFSSGQNYKHADSDGSGIVSYNDTLAVTRNYTKTHAKKQQINRGKSGDPVLKIDIQNDSLKAGDTLVAYIQLGENALPAKDVYGIAFSIDYNRDLFSAPVVDFSGSWFGNNILSYSNTTNGLDIALTRTDKKNITGSGRIATVKMIVQKDVQARQEIKLEITDNLLISANEKVIEVFAIDDSVQTYKEPNSIYNSAKKEPLEVKVYPNPFNTQTIVEYTLPSAGNVSVSLSDISGRIFLLQQPMQKPFGIHQFVLDANKLVLKSGLYILRIEINGIPEFRKLVKTD